MKRKIAISSIIMFLLNLFTFNAYGVEANAVSGNQITTSRMLLSNIQELTGDKYSEKYKVKVIGHETNGGNTTNNTLNKAFDNDWSTFWEAKRGDITTHVIVKFEDVNDISKIVYASRQDVTNGKGYPQNIKISASESDNGEFVDVTTFKSSATGDKVVFTFSKPIKAKRIKLDFGDVNKKWASASEIMFFKADSLLNTVENMFTNNKFNELKEEYKNEDVLEKLELEANEHDLKNYLLNKIERANKIFTGEIDSEDTPDKKTDFPVHIIQKTGPDNEKNVLLFLAEGYTAEEQDKFINDITVRVRNLLNSEPFKRFSNEFNVYAMKVVSNESGVGSHGGKNVDTYFKIKFNTDKIDRLTWFSGNGLSKANALVNQFQNNYLDEGGKVLHASFLLNSTTYGGGGGKYSVASLAAGESMIMHEWGHGFNLADEYNKNPQESANKTLEANPEKIKWKEFLGFRDIGIVHYGTTNGKKVYKPSNTCKMNSLYVNKFCEVCSHVIFNTLNKNIENKYDFYVADPIITTYLGESTYKSGKVITASNITDANSKKLEFRTVVQNYTSEEKVVELQFKITDKDGNTKHEVEKYFVLKPGQLKSLEVVTNELNNLVQGDKVVGKVIDKSNDLELANQATAYRTFGTVNIKYKLGDSDISMPGMGEQLTKVVSNTKYTLTPPEIKDYIYLGSNIDGSTVDIKKDEQKEIVYKYARKKGKVTLTLVDENGNKLEEKERYIKYNKEFIPSENDFDAKEGYKLNLPNSVKFDGVNDINIEYSYEKIEEEEVKQVAERVYGDNRYETSYKLFDKGWTSSETVVLASGVDYPDALTATPLASKYNAPILLVKNDSLSAQPKLKETLANKGVKKVIIVGGEGVIPKSLQDEISSLKIEVTRIGGSDRYETSALIAKEVGVNDGEVAIAYGLSFADGLSIASIAGKKQMPILLTKKDSVPQSTKDFLNGNNIDKTYIIGGTGVISTSVSAETKNPERLGGVNRYETNSLIFNRFKSDIKVDSVYIASGLDFPDALSSSALAAKNSNFVLLSNTRAAEESVKKIISTIKPSLENTYVIGGNAVIKDDILLGLGVDKIN